MFAGLFQYTIDNAESAINNSLKQVVLPQRTVDTIVQQLTPVRHASYISGFLLTSVFVVYFALFKASSLKFNVGLFIARLLTLLVYVPLLLFCGSYVDAAVIGLVVLCRLIYVCYFAWRFKSIAFILYNTSTLAFIMGKCRYYDSQPYMVLTGGEYYITFGDNFVPFVGANDLYVAIRGRLQEDLYLVRRVELINGQFFYIFARDPVVGVVNMKFSDVQLDEYVATSS
nr:MAG: ORF3 protein [Tadarida brasiliensis bat alphacoronavirus 2]